MGLKDITEKHLEEYDDVFADIVNVLLFGGKQLIKEDSLDNGLTKSQYKADSTVIHEQERDVSKFWKNGNIKIALMGLENQTLIDKDMPLRVIGYDGQSYRSQLLDKKSKLRFPVITLVLYFGMEHWNGPKSLYEVVNIPENCKPYVCDYKINIFEIAWLTPEQVKLFKSDFRIVADYFVQMRMNKDYVPSKETIQHVDAVLKIMSVLTQDDRFEEFQNSHNDKEATNMCDVLDRAINKGLEQGLKRGLEQGLEQGRIDSLIELMLDGLISSDVAFSRSGLFSLKEFSDMVEIYKSKKDKKA